MFSKKYIKSISYYWFYILYFIHSLFSGNILKMDLYVCTSQMHTYLATIKWQRTVAEG